VTAITWDWSATTSAGDEALRVVVMAACSLAAVLAGVRWLRVAQREHYQPGAVSRFALRWWSQDLTSIAGSDLALAGTVLAWRWPATGFVCAVVVAGGPPRLGLRGRTAPLAWTRRARTLAAVSSVLAATAVAVGTITGLGPLVAAATALAAPLVVDLAASLLWPVERRVSSRYVRRATERLRRVRPTVVAITGSYGKTTTKGYVAHLVGASRTVVASPASFNNRAGLARAVNENLIDGTEVFVAEMGTYGPGEISDLCSWLEPDISVITAIGPVHLERFGSEDRIVEAKAEILSSANRVVLNVDDPRLAALAIGCEQKGQKVWRISERDPNADVCVRAEGDGPLAVWAEGRLRGRAPSGTRPGNVACAVAVALDLGLSPHALAERLESLAPAPHRLETVVSAAGFVVLDDTYNANPAGARAALETLAGLARPSGRKVVVTPGMVELGHRQAEENCRFALEAVAVADDLVVVGRTNRRALLAGVARATSDEGPNGTRPPLPRYVVVDRRDQAVTWVKEHLGQGDIVLYENDLPDHYP
jgi:UDP-N-acetylmuramoyl-tripeptide--D-alanyl-D-alanine ligase